MIIRHAAIGDLDQITAVEAACFPAAEAAPRESFEARLKAYPDHFWLMFDGDKLISFVNGMVTDNEVLEDIMFEDASMHDENGKWQMLFGVVTLPEYRRRGCAARLIEQAIRESREQGRAGLILTCKDRLVHYYAKFGFVSQGVSVSNHGNAKWYQMILEF